MKRVIVQYRLKPSQQFKLKLREPGIVHAFGLDFEKSSVMVPGSQEAMHAFPFMRVEIDPDGEEKERIFAICVNHEIIEAPTLRYIDSMRASENSVAHLFEILEPAPETPVT